MSAIALMSTTGNLTGEENGFGNGYDESGEIDFFAELLRRLHDNETAAKHNESVAYLVEREKLRLEAEMIDTILSRIGKNNDFTAKIQKILDWFGDNRRQFASQIEQFTAAQPAAAGEFLGILSDLSDYLRQQFLAAPGVIGANSVISNLQIDFSANSFLTNAPRFSDNEIKSTFGVSRATVKMQIQLQVQAMTAAENFSAADEIIEINGQSLTVSAMLKLWDPLILDLNGDGINLKPFENGVYFDLSGDGKKNRCGFVQGDDALLFLDRTDNELCLNGKQLFGDQDGHRNGFEKLREYDTNGDGVIDENDEIYEQLRLWNDWNGDGICDRDEVRDLRTANVKFIALNYQSVNENNQGNIIAERGEFGLFNGMKQSVADAKFLSE